VSTYNTTHPGDPLAVRLRIFGGFTAPDWAKVLGGAPVTGQTRLAGGTGTLGRWWGGDYRAAWAAFQHQLAAHYDTNPLVSEVAVSSRATLTGEPMIFALGPKTIPGLLAAGWTPAAEQACLQGALGDYSGWPHTALTFAINPYRSVANGKPVADDSVSDALVAACAESASHGGPRCLPANHGLQDDSASNTV